MRHQKCEMDDPYQCNFYDFNYSTAKKENETVSKKFSSIYFTSKLLITKCRKTKFGVRVKISFNFYET